MSEAGPTGRLTSEYATPSASTGLMLWRVTNSWQRAIRAALAPFDITHVQFVLLATLTSMDGDAQVTQRALADAAATDPMMTSQVLRVLEAKELIDRMHHPEDLRARIVAPTAAGVALANLANAVVEAADRAYFEALGAEVPAFTRSLGVLDDGHAHGVHEPRPAVPVAGRTPCATMPP